MKRDNIFYWITTSVVAAAGLTAGIMYFISSPIAAEFKHLGFPDYFRIELGIAKLIGGFALILPLVPSRIKEWTYAGFAIVFVSATTAHNAVDGASAAVAPLIQLLVLVISYVYFNKRNKREEIIF
jgi:hypothetical protein